jgi:ABC-type nitrate/sulfonate/bicarbonate transport system substrate-binding protein
VKFGAPALNGDVHFSLLHIARDRDLFAARSVELVEFPGGTGDVARAIVAGDVDLGLGLSDGLLLAAAGGGLRLVATAVQTPLRSVVLVLAGSPWAAPENLRGRRVGITRRGGGAHLTALALARAEGWREGIDFTVVPLGRLESLVEGLSTGAIDVFLWEELATRHLVDAGIVKTIGRLTPEWPSFAIAARASVIETQPEVVRAALAAFQDAVEVFEREVAYVHALVMRRYHLTRDDAERWWSAVRYSSDGAITLAAVTAALETLRVAGVLERVPEATTLVAAGFAPVR